MLCEGNWEACLSPTHSIMCNPNTPAQGTDQGMHFIKNALTVLALALAWAGFLPHRGLGALRTARPEPPVPRADVARRAPCVVLASSRTVWGILPARMHKPTLDV